MHHTPSTDKHINTTSNLLSNIILLHMANRHSSNTSLRLYILNTWWSSIHLKIMAILNQRCGHIKPIHLQQTRQIMVIILTKTLHNNTIILLSHTLSIKWISIHQHLRQEKSLTEDTTNSNILLRRWWPKSSLLRLNQLKQFSRKLYRTPRALTKFKESTPMCWIRHLKIALWRIKWMIRTICKGNSIRIILGLQSLSIRHHSNRFNSNISQTHGKSNRLELATQMETLQTRNSRPIPVQTIWHRTSTKKARKANSTRDNVVPCLTWFKGLLDLTAAVKTRL